MSRDAETISLQSIFWVSFIILDLVKIRGIWLLLAAKARWAHVEAFPCDLEWAKLEQK